MGEEAQPYVPRGSSTRASRPFLGVVPGTVHYAIASSGRVEVSGRRLHGTGEHLAEHGGELLGGPPVQPDCPAGFALCGGHAEHQCDASVAVADLGDADVSSGAAAAVLAVRHRDRSCQLSFLGLRLVRGHQSVLLLKVVGRENDVQSPGPAVALSHDFTVDSCPCE